MRQGELLSRRDESQGQGVGVRTETSRAKDQAAAQGGWR